MACCRITNEFCTSRNKYIMTFKVLTLDLTKKCEETESNGLCLGVNFGGRNMNTSLDGGKDDKSKNKNSKTSNSSKVSTASAASSKSPVPKVTSSNSEEPFLGSTEADFDCSPVCMAEKLAKHCIRYEITKAGQLIGGFKTIEFSP